MLLIGRTPAARGSTLSCASSVRAVTSRSLLSQAELRAEQAVREAGPGAVPIQLTINGRRHELTVEPRVTLLDLRRLPAPDGLSPVLLDAVERCLGRGEQCLIFINRRGFAPVVMCAGCGWQAQCRRCDARLTLHKRSARLRCHHCGADLPAPKQCPGCGSDALYRVGTGTQRVEEALAKRFPKATQTRLLSQLLQQRLRLPEDGRVMTLGEPLVNLRQ